MTDEQMQPNHEAERDRPDENLAQLQNGAADLPFDHWNRVREIMRVRPDRQQDDVVENV